MSNIYKAMEEAYKKVLIAEQDVYGTRYVPSKDDGDPEDMDKNHDFPYLTDPKGFVTHVPLEQDEIREQGEDEEKPPAEEAPPEQVAAAPEVEMPAEPGMEDPSMVGGDPGMQDLGGQPQEEPLTANQIGRVYELKKIYSRLTSVEAFLSRTTDDQMLEMRKLVGQSIDLFEVVISNFGQYKENVDEIIITYYQFLDKVYESLKTYFKDMSRGVN